MLTGSLHSADLAARELEARARSCPAGAGERFAPRRVREQDARDPLRAIVDDPLYPCLGARSVFHRGTAMVAALEEVGTPDAAGQLLAGLKVFAAEADPEAGLSSFVATFDRPVIESEREFETLLWKQLQLVHDLDSEAWNEDVSDDPSDANFAFSAAGTAYFVIGLHPRASRLARRAPLPTLVFNPHAQFEELRKAGKYVGMRDAIRARDELFQGTANPMLSDHGASLQASQYSGRHVPEEWSAPFRACAKQGTR